MYGAPGNETLFMQHNVQWIPAGYPGAGDLTVMNNGNNRPGVTTPVHHHQRDHAAGNRRRQLYDDGQRRLRPHQPNVDLYRHAPTAFYNSDGGGAQRLPNGDTLISFDTQGLAFEVNAAGQIDWQFQNGDAGSKGRRRTPPIRSSIRATA